MDANDNPLPHYEITTNGAGSTILLLTLPLGYTYEQTLLSMTDEDDLESVRSENS